MSDDEILQLFERHGMEIDPGANFSAKGQCAQLLSGAKALIEECAAAVETQERGTTYQWVTGSHFETMARHMANKVRRLIKS